MRAKSGKMKRVLSLLLVAAMLLTMVPMAAFAASEAETSEGAELTLVPEAEAPAEEAYDESVAARANTIFVPTDEADIVAAIAAAGVDGEIVLEASGSPHMLPATPTFQAGIRLLEGQTLRGENPGVVLDGSNMVFTNANHALIRTEHSGNTIESLTVIAPTTAPIPRTFDITGAADQSALSTGVIIRDITIQQGGTHGINVNGVNGLLIENVTFGPLASGFPIQIMNSQNVDIIDNDFTGAAAPWGAAIALGTSPAHPGVGMSNITITDDNDWHASIPEVWVTSTDPGSPIDYATFDVEDFPYIVLSATAPFGAFFQTLAEAEIAYQALGANGLEVLGPGGIILTPPPADTMLVSFFDRADWNDTVGIEGHPTVPNRALAEGEIIGVRSDLTQAGIDVLDAANTVLATPIAPNGRGIGHYTWSRLNSTDPWAILDLSSDALFNFAWTVFGTGWDNGEWAEFNSLPHNLLTTGGMNMVGNGTRVFNSTESSHVTRFFRFEALAPGDFYISLNETLYTYTYPNLALVGEFDQPLLASADFTIRVRDGNDLQTLVNKILGLNSNDYTTTSWADVVPALAAAEAFLGDASNPPFFPDGIAAYNMLSNAHAGLVPLAPLPPGTPRITVNVTPAGSGTAEATAVTSWFTYALFVPADEPVTLTAAPNAGYRFVRWETSAGFNLADPYDPNPTFDMPGWSIGATAVFERVWSVRMEATSDRANFVDPPGNFDTDGGTAVATALVYSLTSYGRPLVPADETVTITANPAPGFRFVRWEVPRGGLNVTAFADQYASTTTFTMPDHGILIMAVFEVDPDTLITFDANGGEFPDNETTFVFGIPNGGALWAVGPIHDYIVANHLPIHLTDTDLVLAGWALTQADADAGIVLPNWHHIQGGTTLYAVWRTAPQVTFSVNGGEFLPVFGMTPWWAGPDSATAHLTLPSEPPHTFTLGQATDMLYSVLVKPGYEFVGWSLTADAPIPAATFFAEPHGTFTLADTRVLEPEDEFHAVWITATEYMVQVFVAWPGHDASPATPAPAGMTVELDSFADLLDAGQLIEIRRIGEGLWVIWSEDVFEGTVTARAPGFITDDYDFAAGDFEVLGTNFWFYTIDLELEESIPPTVEFRANGGTFAANPLVASNVLTFPLLPGVPFTLGNVHNWIENILTRTGFALTGWQLYDEGTGNLVPVGSGHVLTDGDIFYAVWEISVSTVTLNPAIIAVTTANLTRTTTVGGTATGNILVLNQGILPTGVTVTGIDQATGVITVSGVRPAAGQPAIVGTYLLTVEREGIQATLTVHVDIQPLPAGGGGGGTQQQPPIYEYEYHEAYMFGDDLGQFRPRENTTRAEVAAILVRTMVEDFEHGEYPVGIATLTTFPDVTSANWFYWYIVWAYAEGLVQGYEDGTFRPNDPITREEYAAMVARTGVSLRQAGNLTFADAAEISDWARNYVYTAFSNGWMQGDENNNFRPTDNITRAEVATATNRILGRVDSNRALAIANLQNPEDVRDFPDVTESAWYFASIVGAANDHRNRIDGEGNHVWKVVLAE